MKYIIYTCIIYIITKKNKTSYVSHLNYSDVLSFVKFNT